METPSRLASRLRKVCCGSVNEIICLITVVWLRRRGVDKSRHDRSAPAVRLHAFAVADALLPTQGFLAQLSQIWKSNCGRLLCHTESIPQGITQPSPDRSCYHLPA